VSEPSPSQIYLSRRATNTDFLSGLSWEGTTREDNPPVVANGTYHKFDEAGEFYDSHWELTAARTAYQWARGKRRQTEDRFRHLQEPSREALLALQSTHRIFKEAAQRYEAALIAYLAFLDSSV
jgi:hypothetical protein